MASTLLDPDPDQARLVASLAPLTDDPDAPAPTTAAAPAAAAARSEQRGGRDPAPGGGAPPSTPPPSMPAVPRAVSAAEIAAEIAQMAERTQAAQRERAAARITRLASAPAWEHGGEHGGVHGGERGDAPRAAQAGAACGGAACTDTTSGIYAEMGWGEEAGWAAKHHASLRAEGRREAQREAERLGPARVGAGRVRPSSAAARGSRAGAMLASSSAPRLGGSGKSAPWLTMSASGSAVLNKVRRRPMPTTACPRVPRPTPRPPVRLPATPPARPPFQPFRPAARPDPMQELYRLPVGLSNAPALRVPSATVQRPVYRTS